MKRIKYKKVKAHHLKRHRQRWHRQQKGICPILRIEVPFEDTAIDHIHKRKKDSIGGSGNLGLIRGVIHFGANSLEGKIINAFKRYGLNKLIDLPTFLRNLADYLENPPLLKKKIIHPNELPTPKKLGKREWSRIVKYYFTVYPNKRKLPDFPKSKKINKHLKETLEKIEEYLE